ncbi:MAG: PDZ domain-containing protein, partial [Planctomycetota bacterium]
AADTGGWYDHDHRRIIAQDLGPSLRHEFLHALHWRALTRTGQRHPEWIMEGLGALVEELAIGDDGSVRVVPTSRTNVARTLARRNRLVPVERFVSQGRRRFMGSRPLAHYAQAQTIMLYLHSQGLLGKFLRSCFETIEEDPTGLTALTRAAGATPAEFDEALRRFAAALPEVPERLAPGMASLGAALSLGRGDGPRVAAVRPGSSAWKAGLRRGDVIEALDGWTVRTLEALRWGLAQRAVGEQVALRVRRGRRRLTVQLPLVDAREELALERAPAYGP